jgi:hypothetical protein
MCLSSIDAVPEIHKIGYKFFERRNQNTFIGKFGRGVYKFGVWYEDTQEINLVANCGTLYKTGFHYLSELPEVIDHKKLNKLCYDNKEILALIEVKNTTASGKDSTTSFGPLKAGVCRKFRIKKILYGKMSDLKQFMKFKLPPIYKELVSFYTEYKNRELVDLVEKFYSISLRDTRSYLDTVNFIDLFDRTTKIFKFFTRIHFHSLKANNKYEQMYWSLILATSPTAHFYHGFSRFITSPQMSNEFSEHLKEEGYNYGPNYQIPFKDYLSRKKCHKIKMSSYLNKMKISIDD